MHAGLFALRSSSCPTVTVLHHLLLRFQSQLATVAHGGRAEAAGYGYRA